MMSKYTTRKTATTMQEHACTIRYLAVIAAFVRLQSIKWLSQYSRWLLHRSRSMDRKRQYLCGRRCRSHLPSLESDANNPLRRSQVEPFQQLGTLSGELQARPQERPARFSQTNRAKLSPQRLRSHEWEVAVALHMQEKNKHTRDKDRVSEPRCVRNGAA